MSENFERDFLAGSHLIRLEIELMDDLWREIHKECQINGWEEKEGLRYLLAAGLAAVRAERQSQNQEKAITIERLQRERMQIDGRYAVMKYRAYQFMQANKILEMKLNACRSELEGLRRLNARLRAELEARA